MIERILLSLLLNLGPLLITKALELLKKKSDHEPLSYADEKRLAEFEQAYKLAFDGTEITSDQRKKLNAAALDFIRNTPRGLHNSK